MYLQSRTYKPSVVRPDKRAPTLQRLLVGERSEPPLSVELSEFSLYLYIIYIYIFQAARCARAVNALRANVGPAG